MIVGGRRSTDYSGDDVGFYLGLDQTPWKENADAEDSPGLGLFTRYGHAHRDINKISDY